jgi:hypothetical protein
MSESMNSGFKVPGSDALIRRAIAGKRLRIASAYHNRVIYGSPVREPRKVYPLGVIIQRPLIFIVKTNAQGHANK